MADYSKSKRATTSTFPDRATDAQETLRLEPLLTPTHLRNRVLFGISLSSPVVDPATRRPQQMSDDMLQDHIDSAIAELEADSGLDVTPVQRAEPHPFDRNTFQQFGYLRLEHAPVLSVEAISIKPGNGESVYNIPLEWVSSANFNKGIINFVPVMSTYASPSGYGLPTNSAGGTGALFLQMIGSLTWMPVFWEVTYTTGFADGVVPRLVNELIGCYAGQEILGLLAATNTNTSRSANIDGMGQSIGSAGPERYNTRIQQLEEKRKRMLGKLRALYGKKFILSNI
jgi:hypothetical protein